jgi:hypothetical protein
MRTRHSKDSRSASLQVATAVCCTAVMAEEGQVSSRQ